MDFRKNEVDLQAWGIIFHVNNLFGANDLTGENAG